MKKRNFAPARSRLIVSVVMATVMLFGGLYLILAWNWYQNLASDDALELAESLESFLPSSHIVELSAAGGSTVVPEYKSVKNSLTRLVEVTDSIHYASLMGEQNGDIFLLADSNPANDAPHPTREPVNLGAMDTAWVALQTDRSVLTKPLTNQSGTWIWTLVPIEDTIKEEGAVILGLSYSAAEWQASLWKQMIPDVITILSLLALVAALLWVWMKHALLREESKKLAFSEALYHSVFEQAPIGIALANYQSVAVPSGFSSINPMGERILGRSWQELTDIQWPEITHPDDLEKELNQFSRFSSGEIDDYAMEKRIIKPTGTNTWVNIKIARFSSDTAENDTYLCLLEDISNRKAAEEALQESERSKAVLLSHLPGMAFRTRYDRQWTMEFISEGCRELTGYHPESLLYNRELSYNDIISPEYRQLLWNEWGRVLSQAKSFRAEYEIVTKTGERKWVLELGQGIYCANGNVEAIEGIIFDISDQKKREAEVSYLSQYDFLTGLPNRGYIEKEKIRLNQPEHWPLSIAICDINGLCMINDAYGQPEGDKLIIRVANLIQGCAQEGDVLGRVSGGEFLLLMPCTCSQKAQQRVGKIQNTIDSYNRMKKQPLYDISLTIGCSTKEFSYQSINKTVKAAKDHLKHRKLLNQASSHHAILSSMMATLYAKSQETEEHGQRLCVFTHMIGEHLGLDQKARDDLQLLSMLHDIGKIGISDSILNKPGKLTSEEWKQMKRHPEIGHRIAMSTPELEHIAEYILCHHERWDGTGYPLGLEGEQIPLIARILAVADSYDAMTEERPYRSALSQKVALAEIRRCAGTQFDPDIAKLFVELISAQPKEPRGTCS